MELPVHSIQHFNSYENRQSHRHWMRICEDLAIDALEFLATTQARQMMCLSNQNYRYGNISKASTISLITSW